MFRRQRRQERDRKTAVPGWNPGQGGSVSGNERAVRERSASAAIIKGGSETHGKVVGKGKFGGMGGRGGRPTAPPGAALPAASLHE